MAILSETIKVSSGHKEVVLYKLMNDQSADETTSDAIDTLESDEVTLLIEAGAGVSGGVVTLEGAITSDYVGTWVSLGTITVNAASKLFALTLSPTNDISGDVGLPIPYIRARISTVITGGTIDLYLIKRQ